jgi:uncharacterized protein
MPAMQPRNTNSDTAKPSTPLRWLIAALLVVMLGGLALTIVQLTDTALSIQERLQKLPAWIAWPMAVILIGIGVALIYSVWRALHPKSAKPIKPRELTVQAIQQRAQELSSLANEQSPQAQLGAPLQLSVDDEISELALRQQSGEIYLALFGEISTGKSSLIGALCAGAKPLSDVLGGTTIAAKHYRCALDSSHALVLADVPGTNEASGQDRAAIARDEALRAHVVALVVTGDLSRSEALEWQWLAQFQKPMWLILNKADRYVANELQALQDQLRRKFGGEVIATVAGGNEIIELERADGSIEQRSRARTPQLAALLSRLRSLAREQSARYEPGRQQAVLMGLDIKLDHAEQQLRLQRGQQVVQRYTKRAVVGAMASVAPGSDLVIQGVLATGLIRELCQLYGVSIRELDVDDLLRLIGGKMKGSVAVILAIVGNAAKAFPGLGTLGGGAMHAVAYGVLFQSTGQALLECLDRGQLSNARIDHQALLSNLQKRLQSPALLLEHAKDVIAAVKGGQATD